MSSIRGSGAGLGRQGRRAGSSGQCGERTVQPPQRATRAAVGCNRKFDARMSRISVKSKRTSPVKNCRDLDNVVSKAVDDAVVAM